MEKTDHNKERLLVLIVLICYIQKGTGYSTSPTDSTSCASQTANVNFNFSLDATESIISTRTWFFGADKVAESDGTTLSPVPSYSFRLTAYGTHGISLSNVIAADNGTYTYVVTLLPTGNFFTATASLTVQVAPLAPPSGCLVSANQSSNTVTCAVNTGSGNCGTPSLNAYWQDTSNPFECTVRGTHQCCATSAALTCYSGSPNDFCILFNCTPVATTRAATTTSTTAAVKETSETSASSPSIINTSMRNESGNDNHQLVIISVSVSVGVIVLVIVIVISSWFYRQHKREKDQTKHEAHHAKAGHEPKSSIVRNELYDVNNISQDDSCLDMNKVTKTNF